ncbi:MAG: 50S ribosomal protein L17 [Candidatus Glassbacteria bacterium RIFCSPLOWO2_12_FULL_58_11]|uniref:Large ribosomal subunit protein bL17 n=2 Tax=Candidatus Glassiibacteriota TaxID=1817805 RepID=A0A1F5YP62_9BACT|nr:MAG: 50S ribosomal protein L17 [Candidatus Glassbacteria bacterium GWA2_58_10]OGG01980.1 MAG: 50S ribosomal protein L17 [Candidatus Glassbacteria bacterium RIFCSPLOWO2_12_FULL_58_11]
MRHNKKGRALNRSQSHRRWLLSNLITSLFLHEKIRTTVAKAKEARPLAEKLITFAKRGDLHARRQVLRFIRDKEVVSKLFEKLGLRFKERPGGYTRILRLNSRVGDNAPMALLELMPDEAAHKGGAKKRRRRSKKKTAEEAHAHAHETGQPHEHAEHEAPAAETAAADTAVVEEEVKGEEKAAESKPQKGEEEKKD